MVNQEGIKFIIFLLFFVILIPLIISFIYIYKTTDDYYKSKKILKNKVDNPVLRKVIVFCVYITILLFARLLLNIIFNFFGIVNIVYLKPYRIFLYI